MDTSSIDTVPAMDAENDIVISGLSACFPESDNLDEFGQNLLDKKDLTSTEYIGAEKRPFRCGKIKEKWLKKFDASFFHFSNTLADAMEPMSRILCEKVIETIIDAGYNPFELKGSRTGVYVGVFEVEYAASWLHDDQTRNTYGYLGCSRFMMANRLSYVLGVTGPSLAIDTACSSSLQALDAAFKDFKNGDIDAAIVAACNLCLKKSPLNEGDDLQMSSPGGPSKSFDESADGYCRAEAVACLYLQKAKDARRIYARILNVKTKHNGRGSGSLAVTNVPAHCNLIEELYAECGVDRSSIGYIEAHGTGTREGDLAEMNIIEKMFCENRKEPLLIGSVKSNVGHTEGASGLTAIAKVIYAYRVNKIPPNLHFVTPRKDIAALNNGKVKVVTEVSPFPNANKLVGVINMGFGGTNAHALLAPNPKLTADCSSPHSGKQLPRLVAVSGRTMEAVDVILDDLQSRGIDDEYIGLYREIFKSSTPGFDYRGYTILSEDANVEPTRYATLCEDTGQMRPVWFIFTGAGCQWLSMGKCLMDIPKCADSLRKCNEILSKENLNLIDMITNKSDNIDSSAQYMIVGITAIQLALVDLLHSVNVVADGIIGHSVGEIAAAYADGSITFEQAILIAYHRRKCIVEANLGAGAMASVGLDENELQRILPAEICIACYNSPNNQTISGPADKIDEFIAQLNHQDSSIFIRKVNSDVASHSPYIAPVKDSFPQRVNSIITNPKQRSNKWISTCFSEDKWETDEAKYASAEYFIANILNPVCFRQACAHVPENAIVIEVAPDCILQAILKRALDPDVCLVPMMSRKKTDNLRCILESIGRIYAGGAYPQIQNLYPKVSFPVSQNTPSIAPLLRWDHTDDHFSTRYYTTYKKSSEHHYTISLADPEYAYLRGHNIRGRIIMPGAAYLFLVWKSFARILDKMYSELSIRFENVKFQRTVLLTENGSAKFTVVIPKLSGQFEIRESEMLVVTGKISELDENTNEPFNVSPDMKISDDPTQTLSALDIYKELAIRGYHYGGPFKAISEMNLKANTARIQWKNNFVPFIDACLQLSVFQIDTRELFVPVEIASMCVNVRTHYEELEKLDKENPEFEEYFDRNTQSLKCGGLTGNFLKGMSFPSKTTQENDFLRKLVFVPSYYRQATVLCDVIRYTFELSIKNSKPAKNTCIMAIYDRKLNFDGSSVVEMLADICQHVPSTQFSFMMLTDQTDQAPPPDHLKNFHVVNRLPENVNCPLIVVDRVLHNKDQLLNTALEYLEKDGFLTVVADENENISNCITDVEKCADYSVDGKRVVVFRKVTDVDPDPTVIFIRSDSFSWIADLQKSLGALADGEKKLLLLVAERDRTNGIIGFFNCLGQEYGTQNIRCFFIMDESAPAFTLTDPLYQSQYRKNLMINIYENGSWGFYVPLPISPLNTVKTHHAFVNKLVVGDLSSLRWIEGPLNPETYSYKADGSKELVHIYYCALNFRDIMLATGKLPQSVVVRNRMQEEDSVHGLEYSGKLSDGTRVMGMAQAAKGLATLIEADRNLCWRVPENWSLEDASTVPLVYATVVYALFCRGRIRRGQSVLIHAGTGGVGQAAINICLHLDCKIFTTVGTLEKREFIAKTFPTIPQNHICNSRDTSFKADILSLTNGRGVDIVINSLAEEKLLASLDCVSCGGQFLEIGLYDIFMNNALGEYRPKMTKIAGMGYFMKEISFIGVELANLLDEDTDTRTSMMNKMQQLIDDGVIKPLARAVFEKDQLEPAFRFMAKGEHIGKVVIKIRDEEFVRDAPPEAIEVDAIPKYYAPEGKCILICGGLAGLGLELADWLIMNGAKNIVLSSRKGVTTGYQSWRIKNWQSYGANVIVAIEDAITLESATKLMNIALSLGPISAIFNLAAIWGDRLFENHTEDSFKDCVISKVNTTRFLDELSRKMCPDLEHFVVYSSILSNFGLIGLVNYSMANATVERIVEERRAIGLPGLAIEWGPMGDVGVLTRGDFPMSNQYDEFERQNLNSYKSVLNRLLKQTTLEKDMAVVSSFVVARKSVNEEKSENMVARIMKILGLKNLQVVNMDMKLSEYGMDSITAVEIRKVLEYGAGISLMPKDLKTLTFGDLQKILDDAGAKSIK